MRRATSKAATIQRVEELCEIASRYGAKRIYADGIDVEMFADTRQPAEVPVSDEKPATTTTTVGIPTDEEFLFMASPLGPPPKGDEDEKQ